MHPPRDNLLLARRNRDGAEDLAIGLLAENRGGALIYGSEDSGRREIAIAAIRRLGDAHRARPRIDVVTSSMPPSELPFLAQLSKKILAVLPKAANGVAARHLEVVPDADDPQDARDALKEALGTLDSEHVPIFLFESVDCLADSHKALDSLFGALRDVLLGSGAYAFATAYDDQPFYGQTGVSLFLNNFGRMIPFPVSNQEVVEFCAQHTMALPPHEAANLIVRTFGFAEIRIQRAVRYLEESPRGNQDETLRRVESHAATTLKRDAHRFWGRLDELSRKVLMNGVRCVDSPVESIDLLLAHPWSRYYVERPLPQRVAVCDIALRDIAQKNWLEDRVRRAPQDPERVLQEIADLIASGDPLAAKALAGNVNTIPALTETVRSRARQLAELSRIVDLALHDRYPEAADSLEKVHGNTENALIERWRSFGRVLQTEPKKRDRFPPALVMQLLATELERARRREALGRFTDAFLDSAKLVDAAIMAALYRSGWKEQQAMSFAPDDALAQYKRDLRACGRAEDPAELPRSIHGGLEAAWLARALDLIELRKVDIRELAKLFEKRGPVAHGPAMVPREESIRARDTAAMILRGCAAAWGLEGQYDHFEDGPLVPTHFLATLLRT